MAFGSAWFQGCSYVLVFLACVGVLAKFRSRAVRQSVLLVSSIAVYLTWQPWFALVLFTSIVVNFLIGKWLRKKPDWLPFSAGILFNLAWLGIFKYVPSLSVHILPAALEPLARLALPLGISFWTFQALSYLFDLYRGEELDPSFAEFALYMAFFPVTISGPVCRLPDMLPQFRSEEKTSWSDIAPGFRRIAIGVLMMQLGTLAGQGILAGDGVVSGFDHATQWTGPDVWCLAFGYGLQLFFDFAGYSHIAIGAARALGITVPENFNRPFASTNPSIFWTRWHMSLSFWIRDYVFFPLAPLRREVWWRNLALALSMIVFGLWHKATWLFLIWGCYHGMLLVMHRQVQWVERRFKWEPPQLWIPLSWAGTAALISFGWIFFRANSMSQVQQMLAAIATPASYSSHFLSTSLYVLIAVVAAGYALVVLLSDALDVQSRTTESSDRQSNGILAIVGRWRWYWLPALYGLALLFVLMITSMQQGGLGQMMYRRF